MADALGESAAVAPGRPALTVRRGMALGLCLAAISLLASCDGQQESGAVEPGIYAVAQSEGPPGTLVVRKDGTYADMEDNVPKPVDEGTWRYDDGQFCLESAASAGTLCFTETRGKNGEIVLAADGRTVTLTLRK